MTDNLPKPKLETGAKLAAIIPRDIDQVYRLADGMIKAQLVPDTYKGDRNKVAMAIMKGLEVGLKPISAINWIYIIKQTPTIWGDGAVSLVQSSGNLEYMKDRFEGNIEDETLTCIIEIKRKDMAPITREFSMQDAKRARLLNNPKKPTWTLFLKRMLFNRARAFAIRDLFADCLCGLAIKEELEHLEEKEPVDTNFLDEGIIDVTPKEIEDVELSETENKDQSKDTDTSKLEDGKLFD